MIHHHLPLQPFLITINHRVNQENHGSQRIPRSSAGFLGPPLPCHPLQSARLPAAPCSGRGRRPGNLYIDLGMPLLMYHDVSDMHRFFDMYTSMCCIKDNVYYIYIHMYMCLWSYMSVILNVCETSWYNLNIHLLIRAVDRLWLGNAWTHFLGQWSQCTGSAWRACIPLGHRCGF